MFRKGVVVTYTVTVGIIKTTVAFEIEKGARYL